MSRAAARTSRSPDTRAKALAGLLGTAGVLHFLTPKFFDQIVPKVLPNPRAWTYASGVAELAVAASVLDRRSRRTGATAAALLFVAVFPANIQGAVDARTTPEKAVTWARLPLQVPLVRWAWRVRRDATG